jgi:peptidoglycan/LPS O-acetylase OafA/YrhL
VALIALFFILLGHGVRLGSTPISATNGLLAPLFAVFIAALAVDASPALAWLKWGPLVALGEMSYAIYMLQDPVREISYRFGLRVLAPWPVAMFWTFVVVLLLISLLVWRWFEVPLRHWLRQRLAAAGARSRTAPVV